jgi:hypothetical protein
MILDTAMGEVLMEPNCTHEFFNKLRWIHVFESQFEEFLDKLCGRLPGEDITYDDYDFSFELKSVPLDFEFTEEQLQEIWRLGFEKCWICYWDGTEKAYAKPDVQPPNPTPLA